MSQIKYCVTASPRSGTRYIAAVLNKLGLNCGHEFYIGFAHYPNLRLITEAKLEFFGDSSWISAPFLRLLPENSWILHQVRDPVKMLNSCLVTDGGRFKQFPAVKNPYHDFAFSMVDTSGWPTDKGIEQAKIREQLWWIQWMNLIEREKQYRPDRYIRYRVEDVDKPFLIDLINKLNPPEPLKEFAISQIDKALETSKTINRRGTPLNHLNWDSLMPEVQNLAIKYGYEKET